MTASPSVAPSSCLNLVQQESTWEPMAHFFTNLMPDYSGKKEGSEIPEADLVYVLGTFH